MVLSAEARQGQELWFGVPRFTRDRQPPRFCSLSQDTKTHPPSLRQRPSDRVAHPPAFVVLPRNPVYPHYPYWVVSLDSRVGDYFQGQSLQEVSPSNRPRD
jgi:hypothetical protein